MKITSAERHEIPAAVMVNCPHTVEEEEERSDVASHSIFFGDGGLQLLPVVDPEIPAVE